MMPLRIQLVKSHDLQDWSRLHNGLDAIKICGATNWASPYHDGEGPAELKRDLYRDMTRDRDSRRGDWVRANVHLLRGFNLACTCRLGMPCHGDVLIDLANRGAE